MSQTDRLTEFNLCENHTTRFASYCCSSSFVHILFRVCVPLVTPTTRRKPSLVKAVVSGVSDSTSEVDQATSPAGLAVELVVVFVVVITIVVVVVVVVVIVFVVVLRRRCFRLSRFHTSLP